MAITKFIPEVWSATLLTILRKQLVYAGPSVVNRNYEGDISAYGDTVHIVSVGQPTIGTYAKDTDIATQVLTDSEQLLTIDQAKYFSFEIDDIDERQARSGGALMAEAASLAAYGLADVADQYVADRMRFGVNASGVLAPVTVSTTASDAYDKVLVPLKIKLDRANVPTSGRWVVVTPEFHGKLLLDSRFIKVNESGTSDGLRNGMVGRAAGFDILLSNNAPSGRTFADGVTTSASKVVTSATANFSASDVGKSITGTGIPAATTIASVESLTSLTLSANATASATGVSITIGSGAADIIAGSPMATTYAEQINKVEAFRPPARFADALKGLHLYGGKVVRDTALALANVTVS